MKDIKTLIQECTGSFIKAHPELTSQSGNALSNLINDDKRTYSLIAIIYTINFMKEQAVLEKK